MKWSSIFGDGIFLQSVTPKEPLLQTMRHSMYAAWSVPTVVAKLLLYAEALQVYLPLVIEIAMLNVFSSVASGQVICFI